MTWLAFQFGGVQNTWNLYFLLHTTSTTSFGGNNFTVNPIFHDAEYRLRSNSPMIDAGDPSFDFSREPLDPGGRRGGGRIDIGAYGNTPEATLFYNGSASPTPNPAVLSNSYATSQTSIVWTAAEGVDGGGNRQFIEYEFSSTAGNRSFGLSNTFSTFGLSPNTKYTMQVRMRDSLGNITPAFIGNTPPHARYTLAKATNVKAVGGHGDQDGFFNDISWDPTTASQVRIYSVTTNENFTATTSPYRHKGLVNGAPYIYRIFPINGDNIESTEYGLAVGRPEKKTSPKDYRIRTYDMEFNVSSPVQTFPTLPAYPTWSPDGKKIAFTKVQSDNVGDLTVISVERPELPVKETINSSVTTFVTSSDGKVKIEIPPGAVPNGSIVTITPIMTLDDEMLERIVSAGIGVTFAYELKKFGPDGNLDESPFTKPVTLTMTYDDAGLTSVDEQNLHIFTYNRSKGLWEPIFSEFRTFNTEQNTVSGTIEHFSIFTAILDDVPPDPPVLDQARTPTNKSKISVTGVAEPLSEVTLFKNGASFATVSAQPISGTFAFANVPVDAGDNLFSAGAKDGAGNVGGLSSTVKVTGDFAGPQLAEGTAKTSILNLQDQARFEYTLSENGVITILIFTADGKVVRTVRQEVPGGVPSSFSWDARNDAGRVTEEGEYKYLIAGADLAGNPADRFLEGAVVFDTAAPLAEFVSPGPDSVVGRTVIVQGTAFDFNFDHFDLWFADNADMRDSVLLNHSTSSVRDGQLGVWSAGALKDGTYYLRITTADRLGRGAARTIAVNVDNTPPALTLTAPKPGDVFRFDQDPELIGAVSDAHLKHYYAEYLNADNPQQWNRFPDIGTEPRAAAPLIKVTGLTDGIYDLKIRAVDEAGNISEQIVTGIAIDRGIRELAITSPAEGAVAGGFVEVAGTVKDHNLDRYELRLGRGDAPEQWVPLASAGKEKDNEFLAGFASGEQTDGVYTLSLVADDLLGNRQESRRIVTLDNTAPTVSVAYPSPGSSLVGLVHFRGSVLDDHLSKYRVEYRETARAGSTWRPLGTDQFRTVTNGLLVSEQLPTILLNDGPISVRVTAEDRAGNTTIQEFSYTVDNVQIDIQSFTVQPDLISPNNDAVSDALSIVVSAPDVPGASVFADVQVLDQSGAAIKVIADDLPAQTGPNTYPWDGTDALGKTVPDGQYQITAEIFDNRSNRSRKLTKDVVVDTKIDAADIRRILVVNGPGNVSQYKLNESDAPAEHGLVEVASGLLNIEGVASDANFRDWGLFYRVGLQPRVKFLTGTTPPAADEFGAFDVDALGAEEVAFILQAADLAGNVAEDTAVVKVDLQGPVVTLTSPAQGEIVIGALNVTGTVFDANLREYAVTVNGTTDPAFSKVLAVGSTPVSNGSIVNAAADFPDGVYELSVRATDKASRAASTLREFRIDRTAPVTSLNISNVLQQGNPIVVDFTSVFTLTASDAVSGVSKTEFKIGGGPFVEGTQFNISQANGYTVYFRSTDRAGNVEEAKTIAVVVNTPAPPDVAAPVTQIAFDPPAFVGASDRIISASTKISLSASDDASGVLLTEFSLDGAPFSKFTEAIQISKAGTHRIQFRSKDLAGNQEADQEATVVVDAAPPATKLDLTVVPHILSEGVLYLPPIHQLAFQATDDVAGVRTTEYRIGNGDLQTVTPFQVSQPGLVNLQFRSIDNVSNAEAHNNQAVYVDQKAPVTTLLKDGVAVQGGQIVASRGSAFRLEAVDVGVGVETIFFAINQAEPKPFTADIQITEDGVHTISFFAVDRLGTRETENKVTVTLDNAPPVSSLALTGPQIAADRLYVTSKTLASITAQDAVTRVSRIEYRLNSAAALSLFDAPFTLNAAGVNKIEFRSVDALGNAETAKSTEVFVDNDGPRVEGIQSAYTLSSGKTLAIAALIEDAGSGVDAAVLHYFDPVGGQRSVAFVQGSAVVAFGEKDVGVFSFFVEARDKLGNTTRVPANLTYTIQVVDDIPPALTVAPVVTPTKDAVTLSIQVSDNISSPENILVTGNASPYEQEGVYDVQLAALDEAGNRSTKQISFIVDRSGPAVDITSPQIDQVFVGGRDTFKVLFAVTDRFDPQPTTTAQLKHIASGTIIPVVSGQVIDLLSIPEGAWEMTVESTDWLGNKTAALRKFSLSIDNTPPVIVIDPVQTPTNQDVNISFGVGDDHTPSNLIAVSLLGDRPPYTTDGIYTVTLVAVDESGNRSDAGVTFQIDKTPPVTTHDFVSPSKGWNNAPVTVKFTAVDPPMSLDKSFTGVAYTQFQVQGPQPQQGQGTEVQITANGVHQVSYFSVDAVGNQEAVRTIEVKIDQTAPALTITSPAAGFATQNAVTVAYQTSDDFTPLQNILVTGRTAFDEEGAHTATLRAEDLAGNSREATVVFIIDRTPPVLTINTVTTPTNQDVVVTYSVSDNFSAENEIVVQGQREFRQEGSFTAALTATDKAGNSTTQSVSFVIDRTKPTIKIHTVTTPRRDDVQLTFDISDDISPVEKLQVTGQTAFNTEGTFSPVLTARDEAGNEASDQITFVIDKTPPVTTAALNPALNLKGWTTSDVVVSLSAVDPQLADASGAGSGVKETRFALNNGPSTIGASADVKGEGIHTLSYYSADNVGNVEAAQSTTIRIDRHAPFFDTFFPRGGETLIAKKDPFVVRAGAKDNLDEFPEVKIFLVKTIGDIRLQVMDGEKIEPLSIASGKWILEATATDAAGNKSQILSGEFTIIHDIQPPRTSVAVGEPNRVAAADGTIFIASMTPITLTAVDDLVDSGDGVGLGVANTEFRIDNGPFTAGTSFTIAAEGPHTITFRSTDNLSNVEADQNLSLVMSHTLGTHELFVNDSSQTGDGFTTAVGDDATGFGTRGRPFRTIMKAMGFAREGDTVFIDAGSYAEAVQIDTDNIVLIGKDSGSAVIDPPGSNNSSGLYGIYASNRHHLRIESLGVTGAFDGIRWTNVDNSVIRSVTSSGNWEMGIYLENGSNFNTIVDNLVFGHTASGIYVQGSSFDTITGNTARSNSLRGIELNGTTNSLVSGNAATTASVGVFLQSGANDNMVTGNVTNANTNDGIRLDVGSLRNRVARNTVQNNSPVGIRLVAGSNDNVIETNTMTGNGYGLWVQSCGANWFEGNTVSTSNFNGVHIESAGGTFLGNTLSDNTQNGFYANQSSLLTVTNNQFLSNAANGFVLSFSAQSTVTGNRAVSNGQNGFHLAGADDHRLDTNTAENNGGNGFDLNSGADRNTISNSVANSNLKRGISITTNSGGNTVRGNIANGNTNTGIVLEGTANGNVVSGNTSNSNATGNGIVIASSDNTVTGNDLRLNASAGIEIQAGAGGNVVSGNTMISNAAFGIYMNLASGNTLFDNTLNSNGLTGIDILSASNNVIETNAVLNHPRHGIRLTSSSNDNVVRGNVVTSNSVDGILVDGNSNGNLIDGNFASLNPNDAIALFDCANNTITNNLSTLSNGNGVLVVRGSGHRVENNRTLSNGENGILLFSTSGAVVRNNLTRGNGLAGIGVRGATSNVITQNDILENATGINILSGATGNLITKNNILKNTGAAVQNQAAVHSLDLNYWGTTDRAEVLAGITGPADVPTFRFSPVDTAPGADTVAPAVPRTIDGRVLKPYGHVEITWTAPVADEEDPALDDIAGIRIYRSLAVPDPAQRHPALVELAPDATSFVDETASGGFVYYWMTSFDKNANGLENESWFADTLTVIRDILPPRTTLTTGELTFVAPDGATYVTSTTPLTLTAVDDQVVVGDATGLGVAKIEAAADNGAFVTVTGPVTLGGFGVTSEGVHVLSFRATDVLGSVEQTKTSTLYIDVTAPVTASTQNPPQNANGWNNTAVTVSLTAADPALADASRAGSGVKETRFGVDGAAPSAGTLAALTTEAIHTVDFYSLDNMNNVEATKQTTVRIDLTDPVTGIALGTPKVVDPDQTYVTSQTQFTLSAIDAFSGLAKTEYRIDGGSFILYAPFSLSSLEGARTIGFKSTDIADNEETERIIQIIVDNTAPTTAYSVDVKDEGGTVLIPESLITLSTIDGGAKPVGISRIEYQLDGGTVTSVSSTATTFGVDALALGAHTLSFRAVDRLGNAEAFQTFAFTISPAIEASKFESFATRVLVWINDKDHPEGDDDDDDEGDDGGGDDGDDSDDDENEGDTIPPENIAVLKTILDSAPILLYDVVEHADTFVALMRTDSYNLYLIIGDDDHLDDKEEWELSERVRMGDGLISSVFHKVYKPVHDKGEHEGQDDDEKGKGKGKDDDGDDDDDQEKQTKASKNLLGVEVDGKHGDKDLNIAFAGSIPVTSGISNYQTVAETKRVRAVAPGAGTDGLVTPKGKDKEPEPSVVTTSFGSGRTVFYAFDVGRSASPSNSDATETLLRAALRYATPTRDVHIPDGRTAIGMTVRSLVVPLDLALSVDEKVDGGGSVVNGIDGTVTPPDRVRWNLTLDANGTDTVHYVLGLVDAGEATVTANARISYLVRGSYFSHAPFENLTLTIVTEKDLPALLDQAVTQFNALKLDDDDGDDEVEDAVKELQKQRTTPPSTKDKIEDAMEEVLKIIKDMDEIDAKQASLDAIRDTLDKIIFIYERKWAQ